MSCEGKGEINNNNNNPNHLSRDGVERRNYAITRLVVFGSVFLGFVLLARIGTVW